MSPRRRDIKKRRHVWKTALKFGFISSETLYCLKKKWRKRGRRWWLRMLREHKFQMAAYMDAWVTPSYLPRVRVIAIDEAALCSGPEVPS